MDGNSERKTERVRDGKKKKMLKQQTFIRAYGNVMTEECGKLEFDAITTGKFPPYGGYSSSVMIDIVI